MATVLCIDDDPKILELHRAVLGRSGYNVLTAVDGLIGLTLTRTHHVDAVVLDFAMAGMDGNAIAEALIREQPNLPVVVWTGCIDEIPESLKWYADVLLEKTNGPHVLISTIEKLINASAALKKAAARPSIREGEPLVA
jgi:two-component system, OmpR family, alkaline phosphatase synthesis response regulator PhoP